MTFENVQVFNFFDAAASSSELTAQFVHDALLRDDVIVECDGVGVGHISNIHPVNKDLNADVWIKNDFIYRTGAADFYIDQYELVRARNNEILALKLKFVPETNWWERIKKRFSLNGKAPKT